MDPKKWPYFLNQGIELSSRVRCRKLLLDLVDAELTSLGPLRSQGICGTIPSGFDLRCSGLHGPGESISILCTALEK